MKKALIYRDDKTQKFWTVDCSGCDFCVHYGRCGTIGKFQIKEFQSEQACAAAAERLLREKLKKGYREDPGFDFDGQLYLDDEEVGVHPKTCHPRFLRRFTEAFYYDCTDEDSPFGSDEGADVLDALGTALRRRRDFDFCTLPRRLIEEDWGMDYLPPEAGEAPKREQDCVQSDLVTYSTAFAEIKITGRSTPVLRERAVGSLQRLQRLLGESEQRTRMIEDLRSYRDE